MKVLRILSFLMIIILITNLFVPTEVFSLESPLVIEKIIGLSKEAGTFRMMPMDGAILYPFYKQGIDVINDGLIYICDSGESQIEVFNSDLKPLRNFGEIGTGIGKFQYITDICIGKDGTIYALDSFNSYIQVFNKNEEYLYHFDIKTPDDKYFSIPTTFVLTGEEELIVADALNGVKIFSKDGTFFGKVSLKFKDEYSEYEMENIYITDMDIDSNGNVFMLLNCGTDGCPTFIVYSTKKKKVISMIPTSDQFLGIGTCFSIQDSYLYLCLANLYYELKPTSCSFGIKFKIVGKTQKIYLKPEEFFYGEESYINRYACREDSIILPTAIKATQDKIFIVDGYWNKLVVLNHKKEKIGEFQSPVRLYGWQYGDKEIPEGILSNPQGICVDRLGQIFVADSNNHRVLVFNREGKEIKRLGSRLGIRFGEAFLNYDIPKEGEFYFPTGIIFDRNDYLYVSDTELNVVQVFNPDLNPLYTMFENFKIPQGFDLDLEGNLMSINSESNKLYKFDISKIKYKEVKKIDTILLPEDTFPIDITSDYNGNIYVSLGRPDIIHVYDNEGHLISEWFSEDPLSPSAFRGLQGVAKSSDGNIYTVNTHGGNIQKFDTKGKLIWNAPLNWPGLTFIDVDYQGKIYVTDCFHGVVLVFSDKTSKDLTPPKLIIEELPSETTDDKIVIRGKTEINASVTINNKKIAVSREGEFKEIFNLNSGENKFTIIASDPVGNKAVIEKTTFCKKQVIITMWIGKKLIKINGFEEELEAPPFINKKTNKTFAPIRVIVEAIGGNVFWDTKEQKVTIKVYELEIELWINKPTISVNKKTYTIDKDDVPIIVDGRTYLPLRLVTELIGFKLDWNDKEQKITLVYIPSLEPKPPDKGEEKTPSKGWIKTYGFASYDNLEGAFKTNDSGIMLFSHTNSSLGNLLVTKLTNTGEVEWSKIHKFRDENTYYEVERIIQTRSGEYVLFMRDHIFNYDDDSVEINFVVIKIDLNGEVKLIKEIEFENKDITKIFKSVYETQDGGFLLFIQIYQPDNKTGQGKTSYFFLKLNSKGEKEWQKSLVFSSNSESLWIDNLVAITPDIYTSITVKSTGSDYNAPMKVILVNFNLDGTVYWSKEVTLTGENINFFKTSDNGYLVYSCKTNFRSDNQTEISLIKFDSNGNIEWAKHIKSEKSFYLKLASLTQTSNGSYFLSGVFNYSERFYFDKFGITRYEPNIPGIFVIKLDEKGELEWERFLYHIYFEYFYPSSLIELDNNEFILFCTTNEVQWEGSSVMALKICSDERFFESEKYIRDIDLHFSKLKTNFIDSDSKIEINKSDLNVKIDEILDIKAENVSLRVKTISNSRTDEPCKCGIKGSLNSDICVMEIYEAITGDLIWVEPVINRRIFDTYLRLKEGTYKVIPVTDRQETEPQFVKLNLKCGSKEEIRFHAISKMYFTIGSTSITVNGTGTSIKEPPYLSDDEYMLPLEVICKGICANYSWNSKTGKVTITFEDKKIIANVGSKEILINSKYETINKDIEVKNENVFVPLDFLKKAFEAKVEIFSEEKSVRITI